MASQTDRGMVSLGPEVKTELGRCLKALKEQHGTRATRAQLVGALLEGVPLWQVDHMVRAYIMHTEDDEDEDDE